MEKEAGLFYRIAKKLGKESTSVSVGKMMSSPGIKSGGRVFAFYYRKEMVFRLCKDFEPGSVKLVRYKYLNPFKNKGPLKLPPYKYGGIQSFP